MNMFQKNAASDAATRMPPSVAVAEPGLRVAWDAFVAAHPAGSFYHLYDWKTLNEQQLGHRCEYLLARGTDGSIEGILPLVFVESRLFGRILCSLPFVNFGGPLAHSPATASMLCARAADRADALGAEYLELRCAAPLDTGLSVSLRKVSLTVSLTADPDELWNRFSAMHRKNIRRAQKNDLEVRIGGLALLGAPLFSR